MELKIKSRDYVPDGVGGLQRVSGREELLQRVLFKLMARRGSFAPIPTLGSELFLLEREKPSCREATAKKYAAVALSDEKGIAVSDVKITYRGDLCILRINLRYENEELKLTVPMRGESGI